MVDNMNKKKVRIRYDRVLICVVALVVIVLLLVKGVSYLYRVNNPKTENAYLASSISKVELYDKDKKNVSETL